MPASSSASALDPNDPRLTEDILEIGLPPNAPPLLRRMYDLFLDDKLRRIQLCHEFSKFYKCANDHIHCENSSRCGLHFCCDNCACWEAHEKVLKYAILEQFIPSKFLYATITANVPAAGESIRHLENSLSRVLRPIKSRMFLNFAVTVERTPEARILYCHPTATSEQFAAILKEKFPDCVVTVTAHLRGQFVRHLDKLMAAPTLPAKDPYRADLEHMFEGIRAFHVLGFHRVELDVCKNKKADTSNSTKDENAHDSECSQIDTKRWRKCKTCGSPLNFESKWYRSAALPDPATVQFREFHYHITPG